ncbi:2,6-dihydroxypyridine 3-monooxygenase [Aspergillus awamori]|uniref:2,6-dihydroxypyridine 3-monooxygenase n=1 Tax=Aspergillus awamori TaxID=105351 RepID=A0A401L8S1_ASPAW|nr:2,6-dihydroxypyridine 3-monooxygenase [Aspergillus awamori]GKZ58491.1 hypothetical protein AnigIFM49718_004310 [Aspergillus niger]
MTSSQPPLNIVVIGGSLAGLMTAVALKQNGHNVTVIEKEDNERESHMAGVCLGLDAVEFLEKYDRVQGIFSHQSRRIQALVGDDKLKTFVNGRREITNWDTMYYRLRSNFDGYASDTYPTSPLPSPEDGQGVYLAQTEVLDIQREIQPADDDDDGDEKKTTMSLTLLDRKSGDKATMQADLVIGADGPDSFVRKKYQGHVERKYVGYIAWRGTVPESEVSEETRHLFRRSVTVYMMDKQHCIVYTIPGKNGSLEPGERYLNFLWYTNETKESLDEILKDGLDGHRHHNIVPSGRVRQDIWAERTRQAKALPLSKPMLEIFLKIQHPFIQVITDFCSHQAAFEDGKVLLVGDGLSLFRPHTAFSGTQAAFHALRTAEFVNGMTTLQQWESKVLRYSRLHYLQSNWYGDFYQYPMSTAFVAAVRYWIMCGVDRVLSWYNGDAPLLRTSTFKSEAYDDE